MQSKKKKGQKRKKKGKILSGTRNLAYYIFSAVFRLLVVIVSQAFVTSIIFSFLYFLLIHPLLSVSLDSGSFPITRSDQTGLIEVRKHDSSLACR